MKKKSAILLSLAALALSIGAVGAIATGTDLLSAAPGTVIPYTPDSPVYVRADGLLLSILFRFTLIFRLDGCGLPC